MVARPPVSVVVDADAPRRPRRGPRDRAGELQRAVAAERLPSELETNRLAHYLVVRVDGRVVGFGGIWLMVDEAHVTTFAIHPDWRRRRLGERLLSLSSTSRSAAPGRRGDPRGPSLQPAGPPALREVRLPTRRDPTALLHRRQRGRPDHDDRAARRGRRWPPGWPAPGGAEAVDARAVPDDEPGDRRASGPTRRGGRRPGRVSGPLVLAIESSCDETGDRPRRGRSADPRQRRRQPGGPARGDRRDRARRSPPAPTCAGSCPVLDAAWADAGVAWADVDAVAVTYGPGLAGSLLVGINFAKALAHVHGKPLVGVNHLEGHVEAGWLLDPGEDAATRPEAPFPVVALVVSGGHTFLVEMRDHGDYRLLGQTVDDAAGEAFDKVGRLLGLGYPGGPAIQRAAEGADRPRRRLSPGLARATPTTSASAASRPRPGGSSRPPGPTRGCPPTTPTPASRTRRSPSSPGASRTRWSTCSRRRRCGRRGPSGPGRSSSAAASRRTGSCGPGSPGRPRRPGWPSWSRGPACAPTTGR